MVYRKFYLIQHDDYLIQYDGDSCSSFLKMVILHVSTIQLCFFGHEVQVNVNCSSFSSINSSNH